MVHQQFIDKDHWSPNSPDLNSLDYCLWDADEMESKKSLIVALKRTVKEVLCLKVARLGPTDHIGYHKTREII